MNDKCKGVEESLCTDTVHNAMEIMCRPFCSQSGCVKSICSVCLSLSGAVAWCGRRKQPACLITSIFKDMEWMCSESQLCSLVVELAAKNVSLSQDGFSMVCGKFCLFRHFMKISSHPVSQKGSYAYMFQQRCTRSSITDIILPKFHLDVAKSLFTIMVHWHSIVFQWTLKEKVTPKSVFVLPPPIKSLYWVKLLTEVSAS